MQGPCLIQLVKAVNIGINWWRSSSTKAKKYGTQWVALLHPCFPVNLLRVSPTAISIGQLISSGMGCLFLFSAVKLPPARHFNWDVCVMSCWTYHYADDQVCSLAVKRLEILSLRTATRHSGGTPYGGVIIIYSPKFRINLATVRAAKGEIDS